MAVDVLITSFLQRGDARLSATYNRLAVDAGRYESSAARSLATSARWGTGMATVGAVGAAGLIKLSAASIKAAGDMQATKTGFATLLGSTEKAAKLYRDIEKFSLISPLDNAQTAKSAQLLLATKTGGDDVIKTLHAIGNASSSAGGGQDRFDGILRALTKIQLRSKVSSLQLNQIAIRGVNPFKILQAELGLTANQVADIGHQGITGAVAVEALLRGMEKIGGGKAMENLLGTFPGQMSQASDAINQLHGAIGELILPDATKFVSQLSAGSQKVRELVKEHPRLAKFALYGGGAGSLALMAGGAVRVHKALKGMAAMSDIATASKKGLAGATLLDAAAESKKTGIAGKEAGAIGATGKAALVAASAKETLAAETAAVAKSATLAARIGAFGRGPLSVFGKGFQTSAAFGGGRGAFGALGGLGAQGGAKSMGMMTNAGAAASGLLGLAAGVQATGNMKAAGFSDGQSYMYGAATGIGAAAAAAWLPGGAIAVPVGMAAAALVNKLYNEPAERRAEMGSGAENTDIYGEGMAGRLDSASKARNHIAQAKIYDEMAVKARESGDETQAQSYDLQAKSQRRIGNRETVFGTYEQQLKARGETQAAMQRGAPQFESDMARQARYAENQSFMQQQIASGSMPRGMDAQGRMQYNNPNSPLNRVLGATTLEPVGKAQQTETRAHNGTNTVRVIQEFVLKEGPGDREARLRRSNTMTPPAV